MSLKSNCQKGRDSSATPHRNLIEIQPTLMGIKTRQPSVSLRTPATGSPVPESLGLVAYVENMRFYNERLIPVSQPLILSGSPYRPVGAEERDRFVNVLTQSSSGRLIHSYAISSTQSVVEKNITIATLSKQVVETQRVGAFTVMRMEDDSLEYLRFDRQTGQYCYLGPLPAFPRLSVERVDQPSVKATCSSVEISPAVSDFRPGVSKRLTALLGESVRNAYKRASATARSAGLWTSPIAVRIGVRLWDGSLVHLSAPQIILPPAVSSDNADATFFLERTKEGFTETGTATLSLPTFSIRVGMKSEESYFFAKWGSLIRHIEVRVSEPFEPVADEGVEAFYRQTSDGDTLAVRLERNDEASLVSQLAEAETFRAALITPSDDSEAIRIPRRRLRTRNDSTEVTSIMPGFASVMATHGGFLHLGNISQPLPDIPVPDVAQNARAGSLQATVSVTIRLDGRLRTLTRDLLLPSMDLAPLLSYPDSRAEQIIITFTRSGIPYTLTLPLTKSTTENSAFYASPYGHPIPLDTLAVAGESHPRGETEIKEWKPERIVTSVRANPLAIADSSDSLGGVISVIAAQPDVSGSHTRSIVYCFTDNGVSALMHDFRGYYKNLRAISALKVHDAEAVTFGQRSVYALADGQLVQFSDARTRTLMTGVTEYDRLLWLESSMELWLLPKERNGKSLALDIWQAGENSIAGSMRSAVIEDILYRGRYPLICGQKGASYHLYFPEGASGKRCDCVWRTNPLHQSGQGYCMVRAELSAGREGRVRLVVSARDMYAADDADNSDSDIILSEATIGNVVHGVAELPFRSVSPSLSPRDAVTMRVSLSGALRHLGKVNLLGTI